MNKIKKYHFLFFILVISIFSLDCTKQAAHTFKVDLNSGWKFASEGDSVLLPAGVPGNIFLDLYKNDKIPDPYFGDNEKKVQWASKQNWVYKNEFKLSSKFKTRQNINLVFEGLDTYADVILNGKKILHADNMFRKWSVPVKNMLHKINKIEIHFTSPLKMDSIKALSLPYRLPDNRAFTRKAPYQYGWDWGPKLVTMGIWKNVYLELYDGLKINDVFAF